MHYLCWVAWQEWDELPESEQEKKGPVLPVAGHLARPGDGGGGGEKQRWGGEGGDE